MTYTDYVDAGQSLAKELRSKGCQFIVALTHMRTPNDVRLANEVAEIDLILGGHDHVYEKKQVSMVAWPLGNQLIYLPFVFDLGCTNNPTSPNRQQKTGTVHFAIFSMQSSLFFS